MQIQQLQPRSLRSWDRQTGRPLRRIVARFSQAAVTDARSSQAVELKDALLLAISATDRGRKVRTVEAAAISELVTKLEGKCGAHSTSEAASLLNGTWNLAYTANSELNGFLALGNISGVRVGSIVQDINSSSGSFINQVTITTPFGSREVSVAASFELDSPKRFRLRFERGSIEQPILNTNAALSSIFQLDALRPLDQPWQQLAANANSWLQGVPGLPLPVFPADTWLLNSYLDQDLRISRGDGGGLFIMRRQPLLQAASTATYL